MASTSTILLWTLAVVSSPTEVSGSYPRSTCPSVLLFCHLTTSFPFPPFSNILNLVTTGSNPPPQLGRVNWVRPSYKIKIPHLKGVKLGSTQFESVHVKGVYTTLYKPHSIILTFRSAVRKCPLPDSHCYL